MRFAFHLKTFSYQFGKYDSQGGKTYIWCVKALIAVIWKKSKKEEEKKSL